MCGGRGRWGGAYMTILMSTRISTSNTNKIFTNYEETGYITLFKAIKMFCRTDNIIHKIPHI
jgi:hypothetical protein